MDEAKSTEIAADFTGVYRPPIGLADDSLDQLIIAIQENHIAGLPQK
jgi:hypothetical protein